MIINKSAFTLMELMIVIAIIGILYAVMPTVTRLYNERARQTQAKTTIHGLQLAIESARISTDKTLGMITGNYCTECTCKSPPWGPLTGSMLALGDTDVCVSGWMTSVDKVFVSAGYNLSESKRYYRDPWNAPYLLDENEGEHNGCDAIRSGFGATSIDSGGIYTISIPRLDQRVCP